jgi:hypothetical protein
MPTNDSKKRKLSKGWLKLSKSMRYDINLRLRFKLLSYTNKYATEWYRGYAKATEDLEEILK